MVDLPGSQRQAVLSRSPTLVDVATPAMLGNRQVGWARVGIGQRVASEKLAAAGQIVRLVFAKPAQPAKDEASTESGGLGGGSSPEKQKATEGAAA